MSEIKCLLCGKDDRGYTMIGVNGGYICGWCMDILKERADEIIYLVRPWAKIPERRGY
jgi:hypothetical protein